MRHGRVIDRRTMVSLLIRVLLASVLLIALTPTTAWAEDQNGCGGQMDTPHYSSGAGGVIAKWRVHCNDVGVGIGYSLYLYRCFAQPPRNKQAVNGSTYGCSLRSSYTGSIRTESPIGKVYTRYVPPLGQGGAQGQGYYWIAYAHWYSTGDAGIIGPHVNWGGPSGRIYW